MKSLVLLLTLGCGVAIAGGADRRLGAFSCYSPGRDALTGELWKDSIGLAAILVNTGTPLQKTFFPYPRTNGKTIQWVDFHENDSILRPLSEYSRVLVLEKGALANLYRGEIYEMSVVERGSKIAVPYRCRLHALR